MQQMLPVAMRTLFPKWLAALLLMLCILLVISTDDTRIFDISTTWTQDFILPFFKSAPSPRLHLAIFKVVFLAVGAFFLLLDCDERTAAYAFDDYGHGALRACRDIQYAEDPASAVDQAVAEMKKWVTVV